MLSFLGKLFDSNEKELQRYRQIVERINALEPKIKKLSDETLRVKTEEFRRRVNDNETLEEILPEAFAVAREAIKRKFNERAYDVQLMAAMALHEGKIAEQKTGEGKTLSAVITAYLNAIPGKGVHIVTVNDYLARRDAGWYGQALHALGLSIGCIIHERAFLLDPTFTEPNQDDDRLSHLRPVSRNEAYLADVTYGTNNEFGFDYLRDNMVGSVTEMAQRGHHFAIVDEVDSILIDEARTPLIISSPQQEATEKYYEFAKTIDRLNPTDYVVDEKLKTANLSEKGIAKIEKWLGVDNLYEKDFEMVHHLEEALKAKTLFQSDRDYVVKDGEVIIVDEFTGRLMFGRRYSEGLHQAIEAKEGVHIQEESKTMATISFQNYFRMYEKLAGMTGTAATESEEFHKIYKLDVVVVPTNKPMIRIDMPDVVYKTAKAKFTAIVDAIVEDHKKGRPVLIGTTSIDKNELISRILARRGVEHAILNAKNHEKEASIIANAGQKGTVTVATNIAGRGVDIKLGKGVVELGGLHIIGTERHESRRIDNQLRGRSGRQGDPGSSRFYVSLEDDIMRLFGGDQVAKVMTSFNVPENVPLEHKSVSWIIQQAQVKVETFHFDSRKHVVEYDDVMNKQREIIYKFRKKVLETDHKLMGVWKNGGDVANLPLLKEEIIERMDKEIDLIVSMYISNENGGVESGKIVEAINTIIPMDLKSKEDLKSEIEKLGGAEKTAEFLKGVIKQAYELREKQLDFEKIRALEKFVILQVIDLLWIEHLDAVDDLKEGIGLRAYGQRDPLVEYKAEAYSMFERLMEAIDSEIVHRFFHMQFRENVEVERPKPIIIQHGEEVQRSQPVISGKKKIGRNDPCWCGSGKKYKKCHYLN